MKNAKNISIKSFLAERGVTPKSERSAVEKLRPHLGDKIVDRSTEYADCKDLNEWLQRSKAVKIAPPKRALRL
ncbi:MAG: hypothetical protein SNG27_08910 [Rikenellaceae bacterium]